MQNSSYKELFLSESQEYLAKISTCLVKLEEKPSDSASLNEIFRCVHTLKGMSATMGYEKLTHISHQMEDLLDELRNKRRALNTEIMDHLFSAVDVIEQLFADVKTNRETTDIAEISAKLKNLFERGEQADAAEKAPQVQPPEELVLNDTETAVCVERKKKGLNIFRIVITLSKECVMKEARAFLIITNLKRLGEILSSQPEIENIKEGNFADSFSIVLATQEQQGVIQQELMTISEVEGSEVTTFSAEKAKKSLPGQATTAVSAPGQQAPAYVKKIQSMRIPVERLDKIMNLMGELAIAKIRLVQLVQNYKIEPLEEVSFALDRLISALQDEIMQTRLLPVAYILDAFPRVVRDVAKKQNKEVELEINGGEIELDRMMLDEISDPLLHLVRNAVDHGLESPKQRVKAGKKEKGTLSINVLRQKGQISIEVCDDGQGVDFAAVKKTALSRGLLTEEEASGIDEKKILDLITLPGFSTSDTITDISGRGVGLDVVKSKIEVLGGRVDFETKRGEGSRFILSLPMTLAIIKAMLVRVETEIFAIPLMNIRETIKIEKNEIKFLQNFEVVKVREEVIPLIRLDRELGIAPKNEESGGDRRISLVIVEYGKKALGLVVSQVLGEQDIAVKPLGSWVRRTKGIAGATILGDGRVALILDIMSLK